MPWRIVDMKAFCRQFNSDRGESDEPRKDHDLL